MKINTLFSSIYRLNIVKDYEYLQKNFAKNLAKNIVKNISKNLSGKYS